MPASGLVTLFEDVTASCEASMDLIFQDVLDELGPEAGMGYFFFLPPDFLPDGRHEVVRCMVP